MINARHGGYDPETGFDPAVRTSVPGAAVLRTKAEAAADADDGFGADSSNVQHKQWLSLNQHSEDVRDQVQRLLDVIEPEISPPGGGESAVVAGYLHDAGKAHPVWQDALCGLETKVPGEEIEAGRPWAKSASEQQLSFKDGVAFRHELASLLLIDGPLRHLLDQAPDRDLARYLVLAHHGKLRMQVRDPGDLAVLPGGEAGEHTILGLHHGEMVSIPPVLGQSACELTIDLDQFSFGGDRSWTRTTADLLGRYGPFRLAYLEAIVRVADWRASAGEEVAG